MKILSLLAFLLALILGIIVLVQNTKEKANLVFTALCFVVGYFAFTLYGMRGANSYEEAAYWVKIGCIWPFISPLLFNFVLLFSQSNTSIITIILAYLPAFIFTYIDYTTPLLSGEIIYQNAMVSFKTTPNIVLDLFNTWFAVLTLLSIFFSYRYYKRANDTNIKQQAKISFLGIAIPNLTATVVTYLFPDYLNNYPEITSLWAILMLCFFGYGMWKYKLLVFSPLIATMDIVEAMTDALILVNLDGRIIFANQSALSLLQYEMEELIDARVETILGGESDYILLRETTLENVRVNDYETVFVTKNGGKIPVSLSVSIDQNQEGQTIGFIYIARDITERKNTEETLKYLAYHDHLTGTLNRKSFYMYLERLINDAKRRPGGQFALLFMDLDFFKLTNDRYGHDVGDEILIQVTQRIMQVVRKSDHVFRLGGDEFVVILNNISSEKDVSMVTEKILSSISQPYQISDNQLFLGSSIGICLFPHDGESAQAILKAADLALYNAKAKRNTYAFYSNSMMHEVITKSNMLTKLREAVDKKEFQLHFQPIVDSNGRVLSAEALIRWHHPEEGQIPPNLFIPIAEESGLIIDIGRWVLKTACLEARKWHEAGLSGLMLSVNISNKQIRDSGFIGMIEQILAETGFDAGLLTFEITESVLMEDFEDVLNKINLLKARDIRFSIDDFGTGYSSFNYLKLLPIDEIKIDQSFISHLNYNADDSHLVQAIITMAKALKLETVAEGVETPEQMQFLKAANCDLMQGYYFQPPVPTKDFIEYVRQTMAE